jgi:hypothetical protein
LTIEREDLDAAVAAGVLPQAQADALRRFVGEQRRSRLEQAGREDEHFRFMRGFNDFFFAIGILLLGFGMIFFAGDDPLRNLIAAAVVWGLSELLVGRMRLVLPGILLSIFFMFFVFLAVPDEILLSWLSTPGQRVPIAANFLLGLLTSSGAPLIVAIKALVTAVTAAVYYWRFRLPFALLPIAASLVLVAVSVALIFTGPVSIFVQSIIILACGLAVFGAAMAFDLSDRDRLTRRSDCAFWLHLLAAPLIVHSLISLVSPNAAPTSAHIAWSILLIVAFLALIAIIIDRRALLVSALAYVGAVITYALAGPASSELSSFAAARAAKSGGLDRGFVFFLTLVILGTSVIALGVGWLPLRRWLLRHISPALARRLPPVPQTR